MRCYCHVDALVWKAAVRHAGPNEYDPQVSKSIRLMNLTADQIHALLTAKSEFDASSEAICQERISITKEIRRVGFIALHTTTSPEDKFVILWTCKVHPSPKAAHSFMYHNNTADTLSMQLSNCVEELLNNLDSWILSQPSSPKISASFQHAIVPAVDLEP